VEGRAARVLLGILALAAAACGRSAAPPRTVPEPARLGEDGARTWLRAVAAVSAGKGERADRLLVPLLVLRPPHVPSHLLHQDLVRLRGGGDLLGEYRALAAELPGSADAALLLARVQGATAKARLEGYRAAAARDPAAPWPRIALAVARSEEAADLLDRAQAKERDGFVEEGRARREEARAQADRARSEGERAVALAPDLAAAHGARGFALGVAAEIAGAAGGETVKERKALLAEALACYDRAVERDPGDPGSLLGRARLLAMTDQRERALVDIEAAFAAAPGEPRVLLARAAALSASPGREEEAVEAWHRVVAVRPADGDARTDLGTALVRARRWREALEAYRAADTLYAREGGERWKARRGIVTALVQGGIEGGAPVDTREALLHLRAYTAEGGPDRDWAGKMALLLADDAGGSPVPPPAENP
jgi:tetratricopeptide (TPR) repeat protein